jgi:lipopolysaccharide transport system permease protein
MVGVIEGYHNVLVYGKAPDLHLLLYPTTVGVVSLVLALFMYRKANEEMADVL